MRYAMLICGEDDAWDRVPDGEAAMNEVFTWMARWEAAGKIADGGAELQSARTAKTVGRGVDGRPTVTDGPYLELKEVIGGFIMLEAADIDDAVAVAATWPGIAMVGDKVEVRPVVTR